MAAPATMNTLDFSGKFLMNKTLSDSTEQILILQGVGWLTRKAIALGSLTINMKHYKDEEGVEHIDAAQTLSGGISGTDEFRILNGIPKENSDHVFGAVIGWSKRIKVEELDSDFLKNGWTVDVHEHGVVLSVAESDTPKSGRTWKAEQVWGFEVINEGRRYARHIKFTGPKGQIIEARLVYDYLGPAA